MPPAPPPARLPWDFHPALTEERLRICADDGYAGPGEAGSRPAPLPAALPRRRPAGAAQRPPTTLL